MSFFLSFAKLKNARNIFTVIHNLLEKQNKNHNQERNDGKDIAEKLCKTETHWDTQCISNKINHPD